MLQTPETWTINGAGIRIAGPFSSVNRVAPWYYGSSVLPRLGPDLRAVSPSREVQFAEVLDNLGAILLTVGLTFENLIKLEIDLLGSLGGYKDLCAMLDARLKDAPHKPVRQTRALVELLAGAHVQISFIAYKEED